MTLSEGEKRQRRRESSRRYQLAHPERIRAYREKNKERIAEKGRRWREKNRERHDQKRRAWAVANSDRIKDLRLLNRYGITVEQRDRMFANQDWKCAICGSDTELNVDHCHKTGKVRGGLCDDCNTALGRFKDNIESLKNAVLYVETHNERAD